MDEWDTILAEAGHGNATHPSHNQVLWPHSPPRSRRQAWAGRCRTAEGVERGHVHGPHLVGWVLHWRCWLPGVEWPGGHSGLGSPHPRRNLNHHHQGHQPTQGVRSAQCQRRRWWCWCLQGPPPHSAVPPMPVARRKTTPCGHPGHAAPCPACHHLRPIQVARQATGSRCPGQPPDHHRPEPWQQPPQSSRWRPGPRALVIWLARGAT